jgi:hypothetical protein
MLHGLPCRFQLRRQLHPGSHEAFRHILGVYFIPFLEPSLVGAVIDVISHPAEAVGGLIERFVLVFFLEHHESPWAGVKIERTFPDRN